MPRRPEAYARFHGLDELRPVRWLELALGDRQARNFAVLAERWLGPLLDAPPPPTWAVSRRFRDPRERRVELAFEAPGARAVLVLVPRDQRLDHERNLGGDYRVAPRLEGPGAEALLAWATSRLSGARRSPRRRALLRALRVARSLERVAREADWGAELTATDDDALTASLLAPTGGEAALSLTVSPSGLRSRLEAQVDPADRAELRRLLSLSGVVPRRARKDQDLADPPVDTPQ